MRTIKNIERTIENARVDRINQPWYTNENEKARARLFTTIFEFERIEAKLNLDEINRKTYQKELRKIIRNNTRGLSDYATFRVQYCLGKYIEQNLNSIDEITIDETYFRELFEQHLKNEHHRALIDSNEKFTNLMFLILILSVSTLSRKLSNLENAQ